MAWCKRSNRVESLGHLQLERGTSGWNRVLAFRATVDMIAPLLSCAFESLCTIVTVLRDEYYFCGFAIPDPDVVRYLVVCASVNPQSQSEAKNTCNIDSR